MEPAPASGLWPAVVGDRRGFVKKVAGAQEFPGSWVMISYSRSEHRLAIPRFFFFLIILSKWWWCTHPCLAWIPGVGREVQVPLCWWFRAGAPGYERSPLSTWLLRSWAARCCHLRRSGAQGSLLSRDAHQSASISAGDTRKQSVQEGIKWRVSGPVSARGICSSFSKWPPGLLLQRGKPVFERELPGFQDILCKGRNPGLPHCSHIVYHLSHQGGEILIWKRQLGVISLRII